MFQSSSSLDSETLEDPFPSGSFHVAATSQFLREHFRRFADFISSFTSDFLAFSDFQHKIFFILGSWLCLNVFIIFLTWYLYREKITDLLTNPRFVPAPKKETKEKKKKTSDRTGGGGGGGATVEGATGSSKDSPHKSGGAGDSKRREGSRDTTRRRSTPDRSRPASRGRPRQRTPVRTRSISSNESRRLDRSESKGRKYR